MLLIDLLSILSFSSSGSFEIFSFELLWILYLFVFDFGRAAAHTTVGAIGVKVWVYKGDVVGSNKLRQDKISAEANLASGGPAAGRVKSVKSRAEAAVGEKKEPKILEAGGGKKSSEESSSPGLVEAGGGKKITKEVAQAKFEEEKSILEEE